VSSRSATPPPTGSTQVKGQGQLAGNGIRALLERAGLPRHRHSARLGSLLNLSYHQAHRRVAETSPWSMAELQTVAAHHGETLVDRFGEQKSADDETAVHIAGPLRVTCRLRSASGAKQTGRPDRHQGYNRVGREGGRRHADAAALHREKADHRAETRLATAVRNPR
jgi:hypothetical protein